MITKKAILYKTQQYKSSDRLINFYVIRLCYNDVHFVFRFNTIMFTSESSPLTVECTENYNSVFKYTDTVINKNVFNKQIGINEIYNFLNFKNKYNDY